MLTAFTSRSANISWTASHSNHFSPILHYIIHVRIGENGKWDSATGVMTPDNRTSYQLIGLQPYTVYSFRLLAVNSIGASPPSKESFPMITLQEVPNGKPSITGHQYESSSSIRIQWAPPPKETIHGEFLGYVIKYKPRERDGPEREIRVNSPLTREYTIKNLNAFTQYTISLQVVNPEGTGPAAIVAAMTDEGVPSPPRNLSITHVDDTSIKLKWEEPKQANGIIKEYQIHILNLNRNETESRSVYDPQRVKQYTVGNLRPFTSYKIWVQALNRKHGGNYSNAVQAKTDVQGPSAPLIVNLTCSSVDSLFLQWERPKTFYNQIDCYFVSYRSEKSHDFEEIELIPGPDKKEHEIYITNLTENTLYEVKVQGASKSILRNSYLVRGDFSESRKVILQSFVSPPYVDSGISAPLIAAVICASFALILAIISFILWTKYFQAAYYYLDDPPSQTRGGSPQFSETYDESEYPSVPVSLWPKHVQDLHADGDIGFSREYEAIQAGLDSELSCEYSQMMENKNKNRYVNIVAYDHTRVVLKPLNGQKKNAVDYINANYIDRKCDMYWPKEGTEIYGIIQVKILQEVVMATYTLRTFQIRNMKVKKVNIKSF
ncbi:tyrosine-protein phosphatase 99A-like protein [Dinothrombium tinctorium]|uniref:Tyrosine-protein phosphatase 99A-like protein n=1 Tax=Dinothrombium tinctorium TaxID=1965070 RepID=A0A3S3P6F1_9ACAR|nr:tyrosine-protein phosphatase 99A-like protein [Dinothrombium tinctorium]